MPLDFPANPTLDETFTGPSGQVWLWDGEKWTFGGGESAPVTVSPTEPTNPGTGDLWFDPTDDNLYVFDGTNWVAVSGSGTAVEITDTPPANPEPGQMYWDTTTAKLFLWDGTQWIVVVNTPNGGGGGGAAIDIDENPPTNPTTGMLWWASDVAKLFFWDGTQWVIVVNTPEGGGGGSGPVTGTGATVLNQSPTINQPLLMGVTDGSNATPYEIGEYLSAINANPQTPASTQPLLSLDLTPGDWDLTVRLQANGASVPGAAVNLQVMLSADGTTSYSDEGVLQQSSQATPNIATTVNFAMCMPNVRVSETAPLTLSVITNVAQPPGGVTVSWIKMWARRMR